MDYITRRKWEALERALKPCPFCGEPVRIHRSDGGDCRMSRECRHGFYIKCWHCQLMFGYEADRGGIYRIEDLDKLVWDWCTGTARPRRVFTMPYQMTWAAARVNAGLTQERVAQILGISPMYLCNIEAGRKRMHPRFVETLTKLYRVKPEWIKEAEK